MSCVATASVIFKASILYLDIFSYCWLFSPTHALVILVTLIQFLSHQMQLNCFSELLGHVIEVMGHSIPQLSPAASVWFLMRNVYKKSQLMFIICSDGSAGQSAVLQQAFLHLIYHFLSGKACKKSESSVISLTMLVSNSGGSLIKIIFRFTSNMASH